MSLIENVHRGYVLNRRLRVLGKRLAPLFPRNARVLDVGCGDGLLAKLIMEQRTDLTIQGIDVLVRPTTPIPIQQYDGKVLPAAAGSYDVVMFVDVLHHTTEPMDLLREAKRVARKAIIIKDHTRDGLAAYETLRFMDWVGNSRYGVALPYNYWPSSKWQAAFKEIGLAIESWDRDLHLYPVPFNFLFDRSLHFISRILVSASGI